MGLLCSSPGIHVSWTLRAARSVNSRSVGASGCSADIQRDYKQAGIIMTVHLYDLIRCELNGKGMQLRHAKINPCSKSWEPY